MADIVIIQHSAHMGAGALGLKKFARFITQEFLIIGEIKVQSTSSLKLIFAANRHSKSSNESLL